MSALFCCGKYTVLISRKFRNFARMAESEWHMSKIFNREDLVLC